MSLSVDLLVAACLAYVLLLFGVAFVVDRRARRGRTGWLGSPVIYTLSISVYCTSWTFYGAVGSAARNGLEFVTIYLGPTLVFVGWWWLLRKLLRIGRVHRITSIADLLSSRYGKSPSLAVMVTGIAVIATTPYIALQLQSVTRSFQVIAGDSDATATAFWVAAGMAVFTIVFGTRNVDANERHHGVVAAIAIEAIVKLVALVVVGLFAVFGIAGSVGAVFDAMPESIAESANDVFSPRWVLLNFLSATAIICLPRQFQVTVVENVDERHLATASWLFPLYLFAMCLFVLPIAIVGLNYLPVGSDPDLFVLTVPLAEARHDLALLAFLGGFSSATSMVIVAAIAVSTMVSNHVVMPIALNFLSREREVSGDLRNLLLTARRFSIAVVLGLGWLYYHLSGGSGALASIGLIAFAGVAQFLPGLLGGLYWRGATRSGALAGLGAGFALWVYTLLLPSFGGDFLLSDATLRDGPFGIEALRPQSMLGLTGLDPLVHAIVLSLGVNTLAFLTVSAFGTMSPIERLQSALFVDVFRTSPAEAPRYEQGRATAENLFVLAQRILGAHAARRVFDELALEQGRGARLPVPTDAVIAHVERELAGSVGAASAQAMVSRLAGSQSVGIPELIDIADETRRLLLTTRELADKSAALESAAAQLRDANARLRALDAEKDEFLSQVSHELRTPMTSIRSFTEILLDAGALDDEKRQRFVRIIHEECQRLTRLLDEILDISRLQGEGARDERAELVAVDLDRAVDSAVAAAAGLAQTAGVEIDIAATAARASVLANDDRLRQALLNLLSNAVKYNASPQPKVEVRTRVEGRRAFVDVVDNGGGVSRDEAVAVFDKFARGARSGSVQGAGLGLPISRAIMRMMGGDLTVQFAEDGSSYFRLELRVA